VLKVALVLAIDGPVGAGLPEAAAGGSRSAAFGARAPRGPGHGEPGAIEFEVEADMAGIAGRTGLPPAPQRHGHVGVLCETVWALGAPCQNDTTYAVTNDLRF
jgi:hypothetical protein